MRFATILTLFPFFALGSCGAGSQEKALCEARIKGELINPETAQFFDFTPATERDWREGVANYMWKRKGITFNERGNYGNQMDGAIASAQNVVMEYNPTFHTMRVKADSKVGLLVTANYVCAADKEGCACANMEK
jgi:hypothetical protein